MAFEVGYLPLETLRLGQVICILTCNELSSRSRQRVVEGLRKSDTFQVSEKHEARIIKYVTCEHSPRAVS